MTLRLELSTHTPYALQPSSIDLQLVIENQGNVPVQGPKPDGMCLETVDEQGHRLFFVPCGPPSGPPEEIRIAPGTRQTLEVHSRASGTMRDVGLYRVQCHWQGAVSNVVSYRVLGDRKSYLATLRPAGGSRMELLLENRGPSTIEWGEPCSPEEDFSFWLDQTRLPISLTSGGKIVRVMPGSIAIRFTLPDEARGKKLTGRFRREPFATGDITFVLP